jgi:phospholipid/cholesterol/gamma-HCH transport system substrate-binding protein
LTRNVDEVLGENREQIGVLATELSQAAKDLRALSALARGHLEPGGRGDALLKDAATTARALRQEVPELSADARRLLGQLAALSDQLTAEDVQQVRLAVSRYAAAGEKLESLAARGDRLLGQIEAGEGLLGQLQQDPTLYRDLKALVEDLRKHPWKILWKD